jgi:hypothetical protein
MVVLTIRVIRGLETGSGGETIMMFHVFVSSLLAVLMFLRMRGRSVIYPAHLKNSSFIWIMNIFLNFGWAGEAQKAPGHVVRGVFILLAVMSMLLGAVGLCLDRDP